MHSTSLIFLELFKSADLVNKTFQMWSHMEPPVTITPPLNDDNSVKYVWNNDRAVTFNLHLNKTNIQNQMNEYFVSSQLPWQRPHTGRKFCINSREENLFPSYVKLFHFWEHWESDKGKLTEASKACAKLCILISDDLLDLYLNFSNSRLCLRYSS